MTTSQKEILDIMVSEFKTAVSNANANGNKIEDLDSRLMSYLFHLAKSEQEQKELRKIGYFFDKRRAFLLSL